MCLVKLIRGRVLEAHIANFLNYAKDERIMNFKCYKKNDERNFIVTASLLFLTVLRAV